jgi:hypothetical protein
MRVHLFDETGYIEAVFFGDLCKKWSADFLKPNSCFILQSGDIRNTKKLLRAWPSEFGSAFEISVNKNTTIELDTNQEMPIKEFESASNTSNADSTSQNETKNSFLSTLSQLADKRRDSLVNTMCIVCKIEEITSIDGKQFNSKLALRRIEVVDDTRSPVKLALWGKQAEQCAFQIGRIYMFLAIKLTNFGGLSLSFIKPTGFEDVTGNFNVGRVEKLTMWWRQNKSFFRFTDENLNSEDQNKSCTTSKRSLEDEDSNQFSKRTKNA